MKTENYDNELSLWIDKEKTTSELSNVVSRLILEQATELVMFRNRMTHITKSEILNFMIMLLNLLSRILAFFKPYL